METFEALSICESAEVHNDDERLNMYVQALVWRMKSIGCPYWDVLRMCRAFGHLPIEKKLIVHRYHLKVPKSNVVNLQKPPVVCCSLSWKADAAMQEEEQEQAQDVEEKGGLIDE